MKRIVVVLWAVAAGCSPSSMETPPAPDAGVVVDAASDAPPQACVAESDAAFCARHGASCGDVTDRDNCGEPRTAACGTCGADMACGASNVCGCEPESAQELCSAQM